MNQKQKVEALKALLDDDALVDGLLEQAGSQEKQADGMGIAFKESNWDELHPVDKLELALKEFEEWEASGKAKGDNKPPFPPKAGDGEEEEEEDEGRPKPPPPPKAAEKGTDLEQMKGVLSEMQKCATDMKGYVAKMTGAQSTKDDAVATANEALDAHSTRIANLDATVAALQGQLAEATKELSELKGEQPAVSQNGYRPSQAEDTLTAQQTAEKATDGRQPAAEPGGYDGFMDFIAPGDAPDAPPMQPAQ